jgi:hypothetical protein
VETESRGYMRKSVHSFSGSPARGTKVSSAI